MPNYDIYDDTSPTNQYRDGTAKLRFNREDGMETFEQPPAYSALEYSPSMSDEEQVMLTRAPRELLPPKRALFQPDPNPIPLDTRSIRRLQKYRSGFPYRSNFSGLGATISGDRKKVVEKLQKWASTYDKYSVELERLANSTAKMYSKGYLTCAQAQRYSGYAMYFWKSKLDLADTQRGAEPCQQRADARVCQEASGKQGLDATELGGVESVGLGGLEVGVELAGDRAFVASRGPKVRVQELAVDRAAGLDTGDLT